MKRLLKLPESNANDRDAADDSDVIITANDVDVDTLQFNDEWNQDSLKLNELSRKEIKRLDLFDYSESLQLIEKQRQRLKNDFYQQLTNVNKMIFANQVCFSFSFLLHAAFLFFDFFLQTKRF